MEAEAIDSYLALRYVPELRTMFRKIRIFPIVHYLILNNQNEISIKQYWDIALAKKVIIYCQN